MQKKKKIQQIASQIQRKKSAFNITKEIDNVFN